MPFLAQTTVRNLVVCVSNIHVARVVYLRTAYALGRRRHKPEDADSPTGALMEESVERSPEADGAAQLSVIHSSPSNVIIRRPQHAGCRRGGMCDSGANEAASAHRRGKPK